MNTPFVFINSFKDPEREINAQGKNAGHVEYIGTRPGVDMGDMEITPDMDAGHIKYMAERPGSHGLFSQEEDIPDMNKIQKELLNHKGVSWRWILSLEESDAVDLGYTNREAWMKTLRATMKDAAAAMGIAESNLRWVAAFHRKRGHPHVHILLWEKEPKRKQGELSEGEVRDIKRIFMQEIDAMERNRLEAEKTALRDFIRDTARSSILNLNRGEEARALIGEKPGLEPLMAPETRKELMLKLNELAAIMPGHGRIALKYMPPAVKEKARDISAWLLAQPGFLNSLEKYKDLSEQLAKYYVKKDEKLEEAADRAFKDIRDRVAQLVLKGAVDVQKVENIIEQKPDEADYEISETKEYIEAGGGKHQNKDESISEKAAERLWRTVCFSLGREYRRLFPDSKILRPKIGKELKDELLSGLNNLAASMPNQQGKPSYAYLPEELKKQARETAEWLLGRPELQGRFSRIKDREDIVLRMAEQVVSRACGLLPREIPEDLRFVMHEGRRDMVVHKIRDADADLVADDYEEAVWTAGAIYRTMVYLKEKEDEAWKAAEGFAAKAGISDNDLKNAVGREIKRIEYIKDKGLPEIVSRDDWQRMMENLGLKEEEFLRPWFGVKEKDESEIEASQKLRDELGVTLMEERIAGAIEAFENSYFHNEDPQELRWTITTMASTLKAMNIDEPERARIVRDWCQRSGVKITEARLRDVLDRTTIADTDIWLSKKSWGRLMKNLGFEAEDAPECPWQVGRPMPLSERIAASVWKSAWKTLERERSKAEAQSRYASMMTEKKAEKKAKRYLVTDAAIDREVE
ncbi:MobP3 family relaxase [Thermoanaerobacterium sp. DL9XJH110]|uniref:MobP3 family relaxase n=1 Tax=Thermoanaerobacterium sp. DL9XJH110 TaxID=3386643 RepID=UPI003BB58247